MGIRTPDLLIANETLYQLSYTPNLIDFSELHYNPRNKKRCLSIPAKKVAAYAISNVTKRNTK